VSPTTSSWEKPSAQKQWETLLEEIIQAKQDKEWYLSSIDELKQEIADRKGDLNHLVGELWKAEDTFDYLQDKLKNFVPF